MSIKKQYLKKESVCKVTFRLANNNGLNANTIKILGEFNEWNQESEPMNKLKSGEFTQTLKLDAGREYQFRYLIDDTFWHNEAEADKLVPNGLVVEDYNSVLVL
ncbi:MAG: isoamylase early set domain-containing protein [Bacteroidetes bacterium]|nr:isoamylase early set domain-containing protein [Bacteroidota bacterium]